MTARQNAEAKGKEKADAKAARKAERKAKGGADAQIKKESDFEGADYKIKKEKSFDGADYKIKTEQTFEGADAKVKNEIKFEGANSKIKNEISSERDSKERNLTTNDRAEIAKVKAEKLQRQLRKMERRAARAAAKADKLRAEAYPHEEVNQIEMSAIESTKVEGDGSIGTAEILTFNQGSEVVSGAIPLEERNLERLNHKTDEIVLSRVDHTEAGDVAHDSSGKLPDPLTPTSQPCIQRSLELDQEHEAVAHDINPTEQVSEVSRQSKDDINSSIDPANPQKPDQVAIGSSSLLPTSSLSSSSSALSLTDSEDEITGSDGSSSSSSSSSAPNSQPSKRTKPDRVPPPKRGIKRNICRSFLHTGRCKKGDDCGFRHKLPNRAKHGGRNNRRVIKPVEGEIKRRGIGLYQRVRYQALIQVMHIFSIQLLTLGQLVEQERALEAFEARTAAAEGGDNRPLDEAAKVEIPAIDEVAAS